MLNNAQLALLKKEIDRQLEIRCINVETKLTGHKAGNGDFKFSLTSTHFQTVPVIHQDLSIINFGGSIFQDKERPAFMNIFLPVHVTYFGNGENLFTIHATIKKDLEEDLFIKRVIQH